MKPLRWEGVMPAVTTPFTPDFSVDHAFLKKHVSWLVGHGATGIVPCGSLGEGATLSLEEKLAVIESCVAAAKDQAPVVPGIAAATTAQAVALAQQSERLGARGLMVLPPYLYSGSWRETRAHFSAVLGATQLPCMLYNNPVAYGTDVLPSQIMELAGEFPQLGAVKESSGDIRRVTAILALDPDRLSVFVGLDDIVVEGVAMGARGWVAGLVNALPAESHAVFEAARRGDLAQAMELYRWFLPLLRLDTVPEFVQLIKLVQAEVDMGAERVRPPRQPLAGDERERALVLIRKALAKRPLLGATS